MSASAVSQQQSGHQAPASMMARVDRLDLVVGYLEDMRHGNGNGRSARSSSTATTLSPSSPASTPRCRCRPAEELLQETRAKGSLVDRIACLENRVLKMEEEERMSFGRRIRSPTASGSSTAAMEEMADSGSSKKKTKKKGKKGIKSLVQSCVVKSGAAKLKTKD